MFFKILVIFMEKKGQMFFPVFLYQQNIVKKHKTHWILGLHNISHYQQKTSPCGLLIFEKKKMNTFQNIYHHTNSFLLVHPRKKTSKILWKQNLNIFNLDLFLLHTYLLHVIKIYNFVAQIYQRLIGNWSITILCWSI